MSKAKENYHHGNLRRSILDAAIEVAAEKGIEGLTLREVAQRVGVSPMASYRHFANKSALLAALAQEGFEKLQAHFLDSIAAAPTEPLKRLQATGVAYVVFAMTHATYYRLMFGTVLSNRADYPELNAAATASFQVLVEALQACQVANCIRSIDAIETAEILWAQVHGLSMLILDRQFPQMDRKAAERLAEKATEMAIEGLKRH